MARPDFVKAPTYPFNAPCAIKPGVGCIHHEHGAHCIDCAPFSIYYLGLGRRLPGRWKMLMKNHKTTDNIDCATCGAPLVTVRRRRRVHS